MKKTYLSVAAIVALSMSCAIAQENVTKLDEITVTTSSMNEVLLKDTPSTMSVVTAQEIKNSAATDVMGVLKRIPGLNIQTSAGNGTISIRGSAFEDVLFLLNGRKLAGQETRRGKYQKNEYITENIDINSIERIEILRGGASTLYGSEASSGVINIITKKAAEQQIMTGVSLGNYQLSNYYNIDFGQMGKWDAVANINLVKKQSVRKYFERVDGAYYDSPAGETINIMTDIGYKFNKDNELRLFTTISDVDEDYEQYEVDKRPTDPLEYEKTRQDETRFNIATTYNGYVKDNSYTATLSYDRLSVKNYEREAPFAEEDSYYIGILNFDARNTWLMNDYSTITFGGSYSTTKINEPSTKEVWEQRGINSIDEYAFFIQDEISLFDEKLYFVPALRYDDYSTFGGKLTTSLGATFHINDNHRIKTSFNEAYEAPDTTALYVDELYFRQGKLTGTKGNPDLKPKESKNYELRYEGSYENLSGSITLFRSDYKNIIDREDVLTPSLGPGVVIRHYVNRGKAENEGFEIELGYDFLEYYNISASYVHSDYKYLDENKYVTLEDSPEGVANLELSYSNPALDFSGSIYGQFVFDKYSTYVGETGDYITPQYIDYTTVGLSLRKTWKNKYTLRLSTENIFDAADEYTEEYLDPTRYSVSFEIKF